MQRWLRAPVIRQTWQTCLSRKCPDQVDLGLLAPVSGRRSPGRRREVDGVSPRCSRSLDGVLTGGGGHRDTGQEDFHWTPSIHFEQTSLIQFWPFSPPPKKNKKLQCYSVWKHLKILNHPQTNVRKFHRTWYKYNRELKIFVQINHDNEQDL